MQGVHEKENRAIRHSSPVLHCRTDSGDKQLPFSVYEMNAMESGNTRPRKTGEGSSRRPADHGSMSHLRSIYGGRPQKLSGTLSSKRADHNDVERAESHKKHVPPSDRGTVAELIRRFRMTPPAPREERNTIEYWWRDGSEGKSSDTSAEIQRAEVESKPSRRRATSAQSSHRDVAPALSVIQKRPLSANSMAICGGFKAPESFKEVTKTAYEYDAEIDQRLKGAEHLLSDWKLKQKSSESSSLKNTDARRQISATVSILKQK